MVGGGKRRKRERYLWLYVSSCCRRCGFMTRICAYQEGANVRCQQPLVTSQRRRRHGHSLPSWACMTHPVLFGHCLSFHCCSCWMQTQRHLSRALRHCCYRWGQTRPLTMNSGAAWVGLRLAWRWWPDMLLLYGGQLECVVCCYWREPLGRAVMKTWYA